MKKNLFFMLVMVCALMLPSCYATRTRVGRYNEVIRVDRVSTYRYAKAKQAYLFWGLLPLGRTEIQTPSHGICEIKTRHGFLDAIVTGLTFGIVGMQTIRVEAPRITEAELAGRMQQQYQQNQQQYQQQYQQYQQQQQYQQPQQPQNDAELDALRQMLQ